MQRHQRTLKLSIGLISCLFNASGLEVYIPLVLIALGARAVPFRRRAGRQLRQYEPRPGCRLDDTHMIRRHLEGGAQPLESLGIGVGLVVLEQPQVRAANRFGIGLGRRPEELARFVQRHERLAMTDKR